MSLIWFLVVVVVIGLLHWLVFPSIGAMATEQRSWGAFVDRIFRSWFLVGLVLVSYLLATGDVLATFGFPHLFRDDADNLASWIGVLFSPPLWSAAGIALMLVIGFSTTFVYETGDRQLRGSVVDQLQQSAHVRYLLHHAAPLGVVVLIAQFLFEGDTSVWTEVILAAIGLLGGLGFGIAAVYFAYLAPVPAFYHAFVLWIRPHLIYRAAPGVAWQIDGALLLLIIVQFVILLFVTVFDILLTALAILMAIGWIYWLSSLARLLRPALRMQVAVVAFILVILTNGVPNKHKFDDFVGLYSTPGVAPVALVDPVGSFDAWKSHLVDIGFADAKPPLVVLALSGGAYRSSFWSGALIDVLLEQSRTGGSNLQGISEHIRLITGASGGMVAGAYFAVGRVGVGNQPAFVLDTLLGDILFARTNDPDYRTWNPYGRDSLSPIAQHLVQRDLFKLVLPGFHLVSQTDRGEVLARQWGSLDVKLADQRHGEAMGWRPSVILTPMMAASGHQLHISNLDLPSSFSGVILSQDNTAVFANISVATAVEMQAAFPYASPAVFLPPPTYDQPVDAGYYDNFGMNGIINLFRHQTVRDWVLDNTSGVIIISMSAFDSTDTPGTPNLITRASDSFIKPIGAIFQARTSTVLERGRAGLEQLEEVYSAEATCGANCPGSWFTKISFENRAGEDSASLSWYVPKKGLSEMLGQLTEPHNVAAFNALGADYQARLAVP